MWNWVFITNSLVWVWRFILLQKFLKNSNPKWSFGLFYTPRSPAKHAKMDILGRIWAYYSIVMLDGMKHQICCETMTGVFRSLHLVKDANQRACHLVFMVGVVLVWSANAGEPCIKVEPGRWWAKTTAIRCPVFIHKLQEVLLHTCLGSMGWLATWSMEVALSLDFQVTQTGQTFLVHAKSKAHTLHAVKVVSL